MLSQFTWLDRWFIYLGTCSTLFYTRWILDSENEAPSQMSYDRYYFLVFIYLPINLLTHLLDSLIYLFTYLCLICLLYVVNTINSNEWWSIGTEMMTKVSSITVTVAVNGMAILNGERAGFEGRVCYSRAENNQSTLSTHPKRVFRIVQVRRV